MKLPGSTETLVTFLTLCLTITLAPRLCSQTFTVIHTFTPATGNPAVNADGVGPVSGLVLSSNLLYGTARFGGAAGLGTVFSLNTDGTAFTTLHNLEPWFAPFDNSDGSYPDGTLVLSGNTLYGTAEQGGTNANGTIFQASVDGSTFSTLRSFPPYFTGQQAAVTNNEGAHPQAGLVLCSNALFGAAAYGGSWDQGTVFRISTDGSGFTNLHNFTDTRQDYSDNAYTNYDGINPFYGLVAGDNVLYGTTKAGGRWGNGIVFRMNVDGNGFTNLHSFGGADGSNPNALVLVGDNLYGTSGGTGIGSGTVFALHTNGTGFVVLHTFTGSGADGASPVGLTYSGSTLYGATGYGGDWGGGCVFKVNMDGTGYATLYSFTAASGSAPYTNSDGYRPVGALVVSGTTLFGTASLGGTNGSGVIFSIFLPPELTITPVDAGFILSWPTNAIGFNLQSAANPLSAEWTNVSSVSNSINGLNFVTNPFSTDQLFFRLKR